MLLGSGINDQRLYLQGLEIPTIIFSLAFKSPLKKNANILGKLILKAFHLERESCGSGGWGSIEIRNGDGVEDGNGEA
jgi:hypothetical protein